MQTDDNTRTIRDFKDIMELYEAIRTSKMNSIPLRISLPNRDYNPITPNTIVDRTIGVYDNRVKNRS